MGKGLRISLVIVSLVLVASQYQNCSNTSDGAFWDSQNPSLVQTVVPSESADIKTPRPMTITAPQDFFEIQGTCNPGIGQVGVLTYQLYSSSDMVHPIGANSYYNTAKCESGRFTFLVPTPHQNCGTATYCGYKVIAKMQIAGKLIDMLEYPVNVANF